MHLIRHLMCWNALLKKEQTAGVMESPQCLDAFEMMISKKRKRNKWDRRFFCMLSSAESTNSKEEPFKWNWFMNTFENYIYLRRANGFLLVSWKLTSFPLYAFFSLFVMTRKAMICCRMKVSGLVMSTSTSGLLIWLVKPSFIISGKYL